MRVLWSWGALYIRPEAGTPQGGVNMAQALVWNVGTYDADAKGETQVEAPQG